ncbi:MAG: GH3 auxin-responsive promoter family protein [Bacteroidetes bacterium]|nr:GH3 auxin-responsive promoter family protein [Bacteroidota bacterium]
MSIKSMVGSIFARQNVKAEACKALDAKACQTRWFKVLLGQGERTIFGRDHGLHSEMSIAEFQAAVPVRDYEGLKPWVDRAVAGEKDVLWPGEPLYFCKTSGTTSGAKFIPLTKDSMPNHIRSARNALLHFIANSGRAHFLDGKMIFLQGSPELAATQGGIPMGRLSGIVAHHVPKYLQSNRLPSYQTNCLEPWEAKIDAIVEETRHADLRLISGIPSWVQNYFERLLEVTGAKNVLEVFPNLELFVFGGVAFEPYRSRFQALIGGDLPTVELYPASEGFFAYQDQLNQPGLRLVVDEGIFYEFIPADRYFEENPPRFTLAEIELNVQYALVVTTNAGLWAYDVGDTVKFISKSPYRLEVTGRIKHFTSAFGEHVIAEEVEAAIREAMENEQSTVVEFHVAPQVNPEEGLPYHEWFIEFSREPHDLERFGRIANEGVVKRNPYYKDLISGSILQPARMTVVSSGSFQRAMASLGKLGGQNKPPRLGNNREFAEVIEKVSQP